MAKVNKSTGQIDYIKELLALMAENELAEIEIEEAGQKIKLRKAQDPKITYANPPAPMNSGFSMTNGNFPLAVSLDNMTSKSSKSSERQIPEGVEEIKSPMVGTFYRAAGPGKANFVEKGGDVKKGDILCIVEAMKIMNDIKSLADGKIIEILVENGEAVEYGQPLFLIQKK